MARSRTPPPLLYADTGRSADALHFGGVDVPDPFIAFGAHGRRYAVVSALEFSRVRRTSKFDVVLSLEKEFERLRASGMRRKPGVADVIRQVSRSVRQPRFTVPSDFPAGLYARLRHLGVDVTPSEGPLFPEREIKGEPEIHALREGNRCSAAGIAAAERLLRESRIRGRRLLHGGRPLTSERLKFAIEVACLEAGGTSLNTIAAGGDQACDPHERGSGLLRPGELIIVDVFPRITATGFHGDMTRTFLRGRASEAQRALVDAVRAAQLAAMRAIRTGVPGSRVHEQACAVFKARGFETRHRKSGSVGFFHGTGHGLGLEIHEAPRMGATAPQPLKKGAVVTVEPGLYYPGLGACRIEDVVQVTDGRPRLLSRHPYDWELR